MSQSNKHRELVLHLAKITKIRYPSANPITDCQLKPGDEVPPMIGRYRPDMYAERTDCSPVIIGEAKTDYDLDSEHSFMQVRFFLSYLEQRDHGVFVLSVSGTSDDKAKTFMRFIVQELKLVNTRIEVFDSFDIWHLDLTGRRKWRLV